MTSRSVSPSMFHGLPWESWTNVLGRTSPQEDEEDVRNQQVQKPVPISSVMKLPKEDMRLFGVCPEKEPFSVVVCELCLLTVTPQGLLNHMELRHKKPPQPAVASPPPAVEKLPNKLVKPMKVPSSKIKPKKSVVKDSCTKKNVEGVVTATTNTVPLRIPIVLSVEATAVPAKEAAPSKIQEELLQPVVALTPISGPVSPTAPVLTKPSAPHLVNPPSALPVLSSSAPKTSRPPRPDRKCVPIKEREYDPDKHCGVAVNTSGEPVKPCTRSLTCKSHSMSLRRAVAGRSKSFDQLLADHRQAKEAIIRQKRLLESQIIPLASKNPPCVVLNQEKDKPKEKEPPALLVTSATGTTTTAIDGSFRTSRGDVNVAESGEAQEVIIHMPISVSLLSPVSIPSPGLPDLSIDVTNEKPTRLSSTPKSFVFKNQVLERLSSLTMVGTRKVPSQLEIPLNSNHPKSLSVCTFSSHKIGGLIYTNRRMQVARQGLEGALHRGNLGNGIYTRELYANMPITGNNTSAISNVLNNVSTKALYQRSKGITRTKNSDKPSKKIALMGLPKQGTSILNVPLSLKSVVPKPYPVTTNRTSLPQSTTPTASLTVKNNGQFHIPNILGGALKRNTDSGTSQQLNTAQIIGSLLSNHTKNGLPQNKNNMPLVRVAITNGLVDGESKAIYSTNLIGELSKASDNTNSNITVNQNVRLTAAQNANHVVPQITYLTTAPVTFQQLPVISSQQKYPGLSSAN